MTIYKSFNNLILDVLDYLKLAQPSLDVKPNSVARDLFVDAQCLQIAMLYDALREVSMLQSVANINGQDLTNYGYNYGVLRQQGTKSIGTVLFTFRSIDNDISIDSGSIVRTRNGIPFTTVSTVTALVSQSNSLKSTAARYRQYLDVVGITDTYAIEVSVEAQSSGTSGNISKYSIISHSIPGVNSVTNIYAFSGGADQEDDSSYRARILATFTGTNVGTALGYRSLIFNLVDVIDVLVIEPGDPLMTRDGTLVADNEGKLVVTEAGTGGKVDIYVMGNNPQSGIDSFIYSDQSGTDDPTNSDNDFILGQSSLTADTNLTLNSRRVATLSGTSDIPLQPISKIVSVSGSSSGPNFVEQYLDSVGNLKGNYILKKDTGVAGGSSFGVDKLSWTSNYINLENESIVKGTFNGIDSLVFTDVLNITSIKQEIQILNENSTILSSREYIVTLHTPVKTVTRVFNLTTGERYIISDQNPDGNDDLNITGKIKITGRTLPKVSDVLQVDYIWQYEFDQYIDFDNLNPPDKLDSVQDSIEWGFSNYIRGELKTTILESGNTTIDTDFFASRVLSIDSYNYQEEIIVEPGKKITTSDPILNIYSIKDRNLNYSEVYNTKLSDGTFSNKVITLPSDSLAEVGDLVDIIYNLNDLSSNSLIVNNKITLPDVSSGIPVLVNYVASFLNLLPLTNIIDLPISGDGANSFINIDGYQPFQNTYYNGYIVNNKRRSPSVLRITASNLPSDGTIKIVGSTFNKCTAIFKSIADFVIDLANSIKEIEGTLSGVSVVRLISVEEVTLTASGDVKNTNFIYDIINYEIYNTNFDKENSLENINLSKTQIKLSNTEYNLNNEITTGKILKVVFYYLKENDYENMFFSKNGTAYTNKKFAYISSINRLSGMQDSSGTISGKILIDSFNQPLINNSYFVNYNYLAPKDNERITINYEYNKLITDATLAIENGRPITADVLVKAAEKLELDVEAYIIVTEAYKENSGTVQQNVLDNITATLSASSLGTTLDSSDIINSIYNVDGVDRVRITKFNLNNVSGLKLSISAQKNQYLAPGTVTVLLEDR